VHQRRGGRPRSAPGADLQRMGVPADEAQAWLAAQTPDDTAPGDDPDAPGTRDGDECGNECGDDSGDICGQPPGAPLAVWPENWPVLRVWMRLQTQWREATWLGQPTGVLLGLRYQAAGAVIARCLRGSSPQAQDTVFEQLQEMEHEAVQESARHAQ